MVIQSFALPRANQESLYVCSGWVDGWISSEFLGSMSCVSLALVRSIVGLAEKEWEKLEEKEELWKWMMMIHPANELQ